MSACPIRPPWLGKIIVGLACVRGRIRSADRAEPTSRKVAAPTSDLFSARRRGHGPKEGGRMNLEQLRKQAKELLKRARAGDDEAVGRLDGREPILANAQLVLAREHGYPSWPALVTAAEADVDSFVRAATDRGGARADEMLAGRPEIERDPWARLVLGHGWAGDPNRPGGPRNWAPLLYVCHSVYANANLARELLARGADPNATFTNEYGEMSALYGAAGVVHDPELTRVLLEAGANPDDGESVYHSAETEDTECLRLLLEAGAQTTGTNGLAHALDYDRIEPVRMLLKAGADPNEHAHVAHAVRRGRGPEFVRLLHEFGADLDYDVQEALILAALRGKVDLVVDAVGPDFRGVIGGSPGGTLLHHAAWTANAGAARELLARGADPNAPASTGDPETPFSWVVWGSAHTPLAGRDYVSVAEALVDGGAALDPRFLDGAAGPLLEWLQLHLPGEL